MNVAAGLVVGFLLASASVAAAQPAEAARDLASLVRPGQSVKVLRESDRRAFSGRVVTVTPEGVVMTTRNGTVRLETSDMRKVSFRDSVWDGALIGAFSGAIVGVAAGTSMSGSFIEINPAVSGLVVGSLGLAIGAGVDALLPGKTIYRRAPIVPVVTKTGVGLYGVVRW